MIMAIDLGTAEILGIVARGSSYANSSNELRSMHHEFMNRVFRNFRLPKICTLQTMMVQPARSCLCSQERTKEFRIPWPPLGYTRNLLICCAYCYWFLPRYQNHSWIYWSNQTIVTDIRCWTLRLRLIDAHFHYCDEIKWGSTHAI